MSRRRTTWLIGFLAIAFSMIAGQANAAVLYDQAEPSGFIESAVSQDFEPAFDSRDTEGADDFVIPKSDEWFIDSVMAHGKHLGAENSPTAFRVTFYRDENGLPGTVIDGRESTDFSPYAGRTVINLGSPVFLEPGTYWMSIVAVMTSNIDAPGDASRWFWGFNDDGPFGSPAVFKSPGGGWPEFDCTAFDTFAGCGMPANVHGQGFSFQINGTRSVTTQCAAAFEAVLAARSKSEGAKSALSKANRAARKSLGAVKKAKAKLRKATKKTKKRAKQALKRAQKRAAKDKRRSKSARTATATANLELSRAEADQLEACGTSGVPGG